MKFDLGFFPQSCTLKNEIWKTIYIFYRVTASCVKLWCRQLTAIMKSYCLDLLVTSSCVKMLWVVTNVWPWRPWVTPSSPMHKNSLIVTCIFHIHLFCNSWRRHVESLEAVRYCSSKENWDFAVFFTFMLQKRSKCFLFQISLQKYLKWQKERFRAIIDRIISNSGLNDPLKVVHFSPHHLYIIHHHAFASDPSLDPLIKVTDSIWIVTQKFYFSRDLEKLTIPARQMYLTNVV